MLIEGFLIWCYKKMIFNLGHFSTFISNQHFFLLYFFYLSLLTNNSSNLLYFSLISLFSYSHSPISLFTTSLHNQTKCKIDALTTDTMIKKRIMIRVYFNQWSTKENFVVYAILYISRYKYM
jgi:hypothetical protein